QKIFIAHRCLHSVDMQSFFLNLHCRQAPNRSCSCQQSTGETARQEKENSLPMIFSTPRRGQRSISAASGRTCCPFTVTELCSSRVINSLSLIRRVILLSASPARLLLSPDARK